MRLKKIVALVCTFAMAAMSVSGCGSSASNGTTAAAAVTTAAATTKAAAAATTAAAAATTAAATKAAATTAAAAAAKSDVKVAAVFPGAINDQGWNQLAYEAIVKAQKELGVQTAYSEKAEASEYEQLFRGYAQQGYTIIVAHGDQFYDAVCTVAKDYPNVQFIVTSTLQSQAPNVNGCFVGGVEGGFAEGAIAAYMTKSKKLGVVLGPESTSMNDDLKGYKAGAAYVDKSIEVDSVYTDTYEDTVKGKEAAMALIEKGCDVITQENDFAGTGAIEACQEKGICNVAGVMESKDYGNTVLCSVIEDNTLGIYMMIQRGVEGKLNGTPTNFGFADGALQFSGFYGKFAETMTEDQKTKIKAVVDDLTSKKLNPQDYVTE